MRGLADPSRISHPVSLLVSKQLFEIQRFGVHRQRAVGPARPVGLRTVPVQLDTVPVRIAQINRLAHAVIGRPLERDARLEQASQGGRERLAVRIENRE